MQKIDKLNDSHKNSHDDNSALDETDIRNFNKICQNFVHSCHQNHKEKANNIMLELFTKVNKLNDWYKKTHLEKVESEFEEVEPEFREVEE